MVHDIILKTGTIDGANWGNLQSNRLYDLRFVDFAPMIFAGEDDYPQGTEILTSKLPDSWDEMSSSDPVVQAVKVVRLNSLTLEDIGITDAQVTALKSAGYNTPFDLVGVSRATLQAIQGINARTARDIVDWVDEQGFND